MHSGGGYVELCIDGLIERIRSLEAEVDRLNQEKEAGADTKHLSTTDTCIPPSLLSVMSQELRDPLVKVTNMVHSLQTTLLDATQSEYLDTLDHSSQVLGKLIGNIVDMATLNAGTFELDVQPFDLHALLSKTIESFGPRAAEKKVELLYLYDNKVPKYVCGDSIRIEQILRTLLSNAVRYTDKGEVMLLMSGIVIDEHSLMLIGEVEDSGKGIAKKYLKDHFMPFEKARSSFRESGLSLSLSKQLLESMQGSFSVDSHADRGNRFMFSFTVDLVDQEYRTGSEQVDLKDKEVLLVIDNEKGRDILQATLRKWDMKVSYQDSVRDAFTYLNSPENQCDLLILDVENQLFDSALIAKPLKQIRTSLPMILLRSIGISEDEENIAWFDYRLDKPVNPVRLNEVLNTIFSPQLIEADS
ncbi:MAG: hypothetical protein KTR29_08985 [Rhodothermaceae bacterium]|nr:hypothetical protein [Rhodothermaceae bacterium]